MAAAVQPDAFSSLAGAPQSQINIGKSIFYNERINTTGSGLVQVLLVDGSTFTVGPGSDLVIDRFVYDPKKGTGQITASFSKGVMRFVGGKLSKNDGGVTVKTPAGTLAIRGGIAYGQFTNAKNYAFLFVFGDYLKMNGLTVYEPGNGLFAQNGLPIIRQFTAAEVNVLMAALTNSNTGGAKPADGPNPNSASQLVNTNSLAQLINDANTQEILAEAKTQDEACIGEECGVFERKGRAAETGLLHDVFFNSESNSVSFGISKGEAALLTFNENGSPKSAVVFRYDEPLPSGVVQFTSSSLVTPDVPICEACNFLEWGGWKAHLNYEQGTPQNSTNLFADGWWVSGEVTATSDLEVLWERNATATYEGTAWGTVLNQENKYDASGKLTMDWSFGRRSGELTISEFDKGHFEGGLTFGSGPGGMKQVPGEVGYQNEFTGGLSGSGMTGSAKGSFVNNGSVAAGGVMGNWGVSGDSYKASGVFGGVGTPKPGN